MAKHEALVQAAGRGDTSAMLELLRDGADIDATDSQGRTPIMAATYQNHTATVKALIEAGANLNLRDNRQDNPLLYAGAAGLLDIVKLVVEAGADTKLTNRFGGTALIPACERGHEAVVEMLLTHSDIDVNHINRLGWTGLMEAVVLSDGGPVHQRIIRMLIEHGADVNIPDKDGVTALKHAKDRRFATIVHLLQTAGAQD